MTGKNKVERSFRFLMDNSAQAQKDLSGDLVPGSVTGGGLVFDQVDFTGVSNATRNYLAGHADAPISAKFYINDTATTGAYTVLIGIDGGGAAATAGAGTLTMRWGAAGAAPVGGDPEWEGEYILFSLTHSMDSGKGVLNCVFMPGGPTSPNWGTM